MSHNKCRLALRIFGAVQGVGFRPFVYRLANEFGLLGWVSNTPEGMRIEAEGARCHLEAFLARLHSDRPAHSFILGCESAWLDPAGYDGFVIRASDGCGRKKAIVLPDIATCPDCLREINDPSNRRFRYPFTNCTHCGPRFSIMESLPYDRTNTAMRGFRMCPECQAEYHNPYDRRFHAQPNACPECGPELELWHGEACLDPELRPRSLAHGNDALLLASHVLRCGQVLAVKGLGGFHLMVDARNDAAVKRLRRRKHREEKPFAVMFPTLESVKEVCALSPQEEQLLCSPEAPIVLLRRLRVSRSALPDQIAPRNPCLGVMLPSNPLHHLLMAELGFPVVATSGNLSDEPICTDEREALVRLHGVADVFLVHNRPIVRHVDDSIIQSVFDRPMMLRRARGYAPLPIPVRSAGWGAQNLLAVGAHMKNAAALAVDGQVFLSQHIGDLETEEANQALQRAARDFGKLYEATPDIVVADLHPDYRSTKFAAGLAGGTSSLLPAVNGEHKTGRPTLVQVQHHIAHVFSCITENEVEPPVLGVVWDGTGYGLDGTIWGGEFLLVTDSQVDRVAHLRSFRLPGGDAAVKEPRRAALGLLNELWDGDLQQGNNQPIVTTFPERELQAIHTMLQRGLNSPYCTSAGRLFDAVAALTGLCQHMRFEGQAAAELEFALEDTNTEEQYSMPLVAGKSPYVLDWEPMIEAILSDVQRGTPIGEISARFHNALVEGIVSVARAVGQHHIALSGGCFQNRYLATRTIRRLQEEGFHPCWHQRVPPNDGGIALGQIMAARRGAGLSAESVGPPQFLTAEVEPDSSRTAHPVQSEATACV